MTILRMVVAMVRIPNAGAGASGDGEQGRIGKSDKDMPASSAPSSRPKELSGATNLPAPRAQGSPRPAVRASAPSISTGRETEPVGTGFTSEAAVKTLADHLSRNRQKLGIVPAQLADTEAIEDRLKKGKSLPVLPGYETLAGVIDRTGKVHSNDQALVQLLGQLHTRTLRLLPIPKEGLPIAILAKNPWTVDAHEAYLTEEIIGHFNVSGKIPDKKERVFEFQETVAWPFFHDLIAGDAPAPANSALAEGILDLPGYELVVPEIGQRPLDSLKDHMADQRLRLLSVDLAELQYSGRADWKDTATSLSLSSMIGSGGDYVIHRVFPEHVSGHTIAYVAESAAKVFLLILTDIGDNAIGELETARGDLLASGMTPSLKTFTGAESLREVAINLLKGRGVLNGEGRIYAKRALTAGLKGAATGAPFAIATGLVITTNGMDPVMQAPLGGILSTGFALSIPFDFRSAVKQVQSAVLVLMDEGKIPVPQRGFADEAEKMQFARDIALQELVSRQSNSSSARAFTAAPLINGGILASVMLGVPPEVAEMVFMGGAPPMENISKLVGTIWETKVERPRAMDRLKGLVLATPGGFNEPDQETKLARSFARRWPRGVARVITAGAKPPRPSSRSIDTAETAGA